MIIDELQDCTRALSIASKSSLAIMQLPGCAQCDALQGSLGVPRNMVLERQCWYLPTHHEVWCQKWDVTRSDIEQLVLQVLCGGWSL
eukprot:6480964-Amphidinium_carterae.1